MENANQDINYTPKTEQYSYQQSNLKLEQQVSKTTRVIVISIIVLFVLGAIALSLNYFNLIPFSKKISILNNLPHQVSYTLTEAQAKILSDHKNYSASSDSWQIVATINNTTKNSV